jgi:SAM-dependent methyltransferase
VDDDRRRWDERYSTTTHVEARPPEVADRWPDLVSSWPTTGRCLDIASGPGSVSLWCAERGLEVTALDTSGVAIGLLRTAAEAGGIADRIDARIVDLDDGLPSDLGEFDLIVCQRFRDVGLYAPIVGLLGHGAVAVVTVLSSVGSADAGPFHAPPGELVAAFGSDERCELLRAHEGDGVAHVVVRRR